MKQTTKTLTYLFAFLMLTIVASCSDDDEDKSIRLLDLGTNEYLYESTMSMSPFNTGRTYSIEGGDGSYFVDWAQNDIIDVVYNGQTMTVIPKALGNATIHIVDKSNHSFSMYITVAYIEHNYEVGLNPRAWIKGDNLTIKETNELKEKASATYPVEYGGGYRITFTNADSNEGIISIYQENLGGPDFIEAPFTMERGRFIDEMATVFTLTKDGKETKLYLMNYYPFAENGTPRDIGPQTFKILEDVTDKYKEEYPALEKAVIVNPTMFRTNTGRL